MPRPTRTTAPDREQHRRDDLLRRRPPPVELLLQIGLVVACALLYFAVRGLTEGSDDVAIENGYKVLRFESLFRLDVEEAIQNVVLENNVLVTLSNWVYIWGHWPVIAITLIWLHRTSRRNYLLLRNAMFASGAIGLFIFALHPVAPPRHLSDKFVDTVTELSNSYRVLQPKQLINEYAAVPSLHVGWNLLVGIFLFQVGRHVLVRSFGIVSPLLMSIAVVTTANHYVVDGIVGSVVALVGLAVSYGIWGLLYERSVDPARPIEIGGERGDQREIVDDQARHTPPG